MVHILLLILKIIGIILLALITILLLALFWPVSYSVSGSYNKENYSINVRLGWLFHLLHFRYGYSGDNEVMAIRIFGIPINLKKKERKVKNQRSIKKNNVKKPTSAKKQRKSKHQVRRKKRKVLQRQHLNMRKLKNQYQTTQKLLKNQKSTA